MPATKLPVEIIGLSVDDEERKDAAIPKPGKDPRSVVLSQPTTQPGCLTHDAMAQELPPPESAVGRARG